MKKIVTIALSVLTIMSTGVPAGAADSIINHNNVIATETDLTLELGQECVIGEGRSGKIIEVEPDGSFKVLEINGLVAAQGHVHIVPSYKRIYKEKMVSANKHICYKIYETFIGKCRKCHDRVVTVSTEDKPHDYVNGRCKKCGRKK